MEFNFAKRQAVRNGRNSIIKSVLVIAVVVLLRLFVFQGTVVNEFGPYAGFNDARQLEGLYDSRQFYVTTTAEDFFHTDYVMSENNVDKWHFFAFLSGEEYVICRVPLSYTELDYTDITLNGKLETFDSDTTQLRYNVIGDIAEAWEVSRGEAAEYVSSYIIYVDENRIFDQIMAVLMAAAVAWSLVCIVRAIVGMANPAATKSFKKLAKNPAYDPARMNEGLSAEIAAGRVLFENKWAVVTDSWVGDKKGNRFAIYPKADVVWIYRTVTQHRTNGIPSGKSHSVGLATVHGDTVAITAKNEKDANGIIEALAGCGFAAIFGFTPELQSLYLNNRQEFIARARENAPPAPAAQPAAVFAAPGAAPTASAPQPEREEYKGPEL